MSVLNVEDLLQDIEPLEPCGPDLEYDPDFGEMERAAAGTPEQQYGDTVIPAEEPDWKEVKSKALEVAGRTHDLRVIPYLARAELRLDGFPGFHDAMRVLHGYIEEYWADVHPQLDPDDDNDPTLRVNSLRDLCDPVATLKLIREAPLVSSRMLGTYSMFDLAVARGEATPTPEQEENPPQLSAVEGAFKEVEPDELIETKTAIDESITLVKGVEDAVTGHVAAGEGPDLSSLVDVLREASGTIAEQMAARGLDAPGGDAGGLDEGDAGEGAMGMAGGAGGGAARVPIQGELVTRDDVSRMLIKCAEWFDRYEPSSPVPILIRRANRLINKDFLEVLRDLAPDGVSQAEFFRGEESSDDEYL